MKRIIIILIISLVAILTCFLFIKKSEKATSNNTDVTSVANSVSEEDISAMVSQMVEAQLAERLADETTTTVPQETESVVTTAVPQETESVVTTAVPQETESVVTTTSAENASTSAVNTNITATVSHNGYDYSMKLANSTYQAAFQSRFLSENGRETSISFNTGDISKISVATAFADSEGVISDFGDYSEVDFTSDETGTLLSYRIPDSPYGGYRLENHVNFCAVFCIETGDQVYYTSISY